MQTAHRLPLSRHDSRPFGLPLLEAAYFPSASCALKRTNYDCDFDCTSEHAHLNPTQTSRLAEEKDLIRNFKPTCNEQFVG